MEDSDNGCGGCLSALSTALGGAFVAMKLTGYVDWSWWWVLFPFYWVIALILAVLFVYVLCHGVAVLRDNW